MWVVGLTAIGSVMSVAFVRDIVVCVNSSKQQCVQRACWRLDGLCFFMLGCLDSRRRDNAGMPGQQTMLFAIEHRATDVDNADAITRKTLLTAMQTGSLWHVVLFMWAIIAHVWSL